MEPETLIGWVDIESSLPSWTADVDEATRNDYLAASYELCLAFLNERDPARPGGVLVPAIPARLRIAQLDYALDLLRASQDGVEGEIGPDGISIPRVSMSWQIQQKLRPRRGVGYLA